MPSSTASVIPASRTSAPNAVRSSSSAGEPLRDVQPAEAVGQLGGALGRPQGAVAVPDPADDLFGRGGLQPFGDRPLETGGQLALDGHGAWPYPRFYCTKAFGVSR